MEPEPDQDPEHDGSSNREPGPAAPRPDDSGPPRRSGPPGSGGSGGSTHASDAADGEDDGSDFGSWEDLEGTLGAAKAREELLSGFAPGGVWDKHPPGPELVAAVARAAGSDWRCGSATGEELVGLLRGIAKLQSWSGAGTLGVIRALIREDDMAFLGRPRHGDLPDVWDDSLTHEIALALAVSAPSAAKTTQAAWELGARLPGVDLLLRDGTLDVPRAKLVAEVFQDLSDEDAARAEELLLPDLTEPPRKTYTQIERLAMAIAAAVDPGLAERRRKDAEKHRSRVQMFRERSGAAALSGRDLATDETLAAYANLDARARQYKDSGAFPGERIDRLRATAFLDILNGVTADERIACGRLSPDDPGADGAGPDDPAPDDNGPEVPPGDDAPGPRPGSGVEPGQGGSDCPCSECDGGCASPDDEPDDDEPDDDEPDDDEPDDDEPDDDGPAGGPPGGDADPGPGPSGPVRGTGQPASGHDPGQPAGSDQPPSPLRPPSPRPGCWPKPTLTDLIVPLATLLGQAERPGEGHGLGALDPALTRALAATAALSPHTTLCITCACNAGARSRKCHRVKQSPGWNVTQPKPGWHQWTTPRGRTYTQGPKQYPV